MLASGTVDRAVVAYQLQVVTSVYTNVLHDVAVGHPLGDRRESPVLKCVRDSDEGENVGMA